MKEDTMNDHDIYVSVGEIQEETQIATNDTGWSEEQKERMRQAGYDDMDMICVIHRHHFSLPILFP